MHAPLKPRIRFRYGSWECGILFSCYDFVKGASPVEAYLNFHRYYLLKD